MTLFGLLLVTFLGASAVAVLTDDDPTVREEHFKGVVMIFIVIAGILIWGTGSLF